MKVPAIIDKIDDWVNKWIIKINRSKLMHIAFTLRNETSPTVQMGSAALSPSPQNEAKYVGIHLDRRLKWEKYVKI
jgi:hypothetical protein